MADYRHDIEKYLRGEMTPAEMNALEKKALHDPFLADALEGAQQLRPGDLDVDLKYLRSALNKRTHRKNTGWVWFGRIAAGLAIVAVSSYVIVLISNQSREKRGDELALSKQEETTATAPAAESPIPPADSILGESRDEGPVAQQEAAPAKKPEATREKDLEISKRASEGKPEGILDAEADEQPIDESVLNSESTEARQGIAKAEAEEAPASPERALEDKKMDLDDEASKERSTAASGARAKTAPSFSVARKVIRGKVTYSEDGTALPGVNVMIKGSNEGTVTNSQGFYDIPVPVDVKQPVLLFSFIGYTNKELVARTDSLDVQLDSDVSELSEVVVIGYGADASISAPTPPVMELAAPVGGRRAFKQYLESNLNYPEQALKNEIEGKVTVQFSVGMTGQLSDFKVIRGIGYGCDDEVIRLIKSGPKWQPSRKNEEPVKDRVRVRMRFALPKK